MDEFLKKALKRPMYYQRDGSPYKGTSKKALLAWAKDFEDPNKKIVRRDELANGVLVSTVWMGLDHCFPMPGRANRPLIFESMVFFNGSDFDQWRYSTEEEAIRGHKTLVKKWGAYKTAEQILSDMK